MGMLLVVVSYAVLFLVLFLGVKFVFQSRKLRNIPPGPPPLPIIGNLNLLEQPIHRFFQRMSKQYGNVVSLWFGSRLAVVISSPTAYQECFTKHDVALANRLPSLSGKYIFYNNTTVGSCSHGEHWRNLRRITALDVLSTQRVHSFSGIRSDETKRLMQRLVLAKNSNEEEFARVEISSMFNDLTYNNIMRMISGKRFYGEESEMKNVEEAREFRETVTEMLELMGLANKGDHLPFLRWFDFQNVEKRLKSISKRYDSILNKILHENRASNDRQNSMIDHLLKLQETQPQYYTDQIIKGLALAMLFGGTDSSTGTLEWSLSNLLNHPEVLKKARDELDTQVGQDRLLNESDLPKLPYLRKIILETLRLYPPAPILIPHVSSEDITIEGFNIPRDTIVIINGWGMQRDPQLWNDATCFKPERFDVEGEEKKLVAFGMGRRACPGEPMAMQSVSFTLGLLIQCFDWKRVSEEKLDMTENNWITLSRLIPLEAMCKARPLATKIGI
ncbi:hypothetical protein AAZX31_15G148500 [Glycine max]|uniref:Cytochrome P450 monooxygenase CYP81E10 n=2 Tax=Glycine subgen. Soja TaxID=1462606 RepID=Q2LAK9_SOYBN|nr:isoflavone 2'-hydroxylase-like [Glycine max]XP_028202574.1 isoflavone 2'-hydroxylase-like [Glycine soja]ABC68400.1 cytochrome P450 monooxygenase CYP81E10 [Glycine max]ABC68402.1 cytochrome P450 monooxygenase CYP82E13 [Glycine max]KAG4946377.1 hypothetical protein JHK87_042384 [Glycine soja]KAG4956724.1 hypothetical protein JHK85_043104 [Glycine max]KAG5116589.1 hypothetical protein JHK84_042702 [Glycine max]|eukprot:NP_001241120.1 isoflavone 2'-hydroxylase-like [Glycine max]